MGEYHEEPLQVPCLGRPLELGMLYDCRSENAIPGVTLWNKDVLQKNTDLKKRENSEYEVITEDSLERKAHSFDIEAGIKLSFLSGLISVEGSAKYLENKKSSHQQARVTLRYHCNTFFEQLTMDQLAEENIQYKEVFDKGTATHVVTGVQYGVDAVFVFDRELSSSEDCRQVEGLLKAVIEKIPTTDIEGKASVKINEEEEKEMNKFRCTFHGDILLKENPTTFDDAVNVYKNLPKFIMESTASNGGVYGVPKKVYLYPLTKLDSKAAKLVRIISSDLVTDAQELLEALSTLQITASDLIKGETSSRFPGIKQQSVTFRSLVSRFISEFQQNLVGVLPRIRGGGLEEGVLASKIKNVKKSPFNISKLDTWIQAKIQEDRVMHQYMSSLKNYAFASQAGELEQHVHDGSLKYILVLSFGSITSKSHPFLDELTEYCDNPEEENVCESFEEHWFDNDNLVCALRRQTDLFLQFADVNKENKQLKCVVTANADRKTVAHSPGDTFLFINGSPKLFQPPSTSGTPAMINVAESEMEIKWQAPDCGVKHILRYYVAYRYADDNEENTWNYEYSEDKEPSYRITQLTPNTSYQFKVAAICEAGRSEFSELSKPFKTKALPSLAEGILNECKLLSAAQVKSPAWYLLPLRVTYHNPEMKLRKFEIGTPHPDFHGTKVLLVVGATGSGKTTLINGMINYLFGIRFEDKYRFKLIHEDFEKSQAHSQTQYITAYTIHWQPGSMVPYTLVIIDTPGYGDTRGIEQDNQITNQIKEFFDMSGTESLDQLDAVGFVAQASAARLTDTQKYVFDSILSIFGRDIADNIFMMLTFADGRRPPALDAIKSHKLPYRHYFKFNNSVFTQLTPSSEQSFETLFWKLAADSFSEFFDQFRSVQPHSLKLTREVLHERQRLEIAIEGFQCRITNGVNHLIRLRQELLLIEEFQAEKRANSQFKRKVQVPKTEKVFFKEPNRFVTNCLFCNMTCDEIHGIAENKEKDHFASKRGSREDASCTVCTQHCDWGNHYNRNYYYEDSVREEVVTLEDLKKKYDRADKKLSEMGNLFAGIAEEYNKVQEEVLKVIETVRECLLRLDEIAMKRNPLTAVEYINVLIRSTKNEKKFGWEQRLDQLENARKRAVMIQKMVNEGKAFDPFKELREEIEREAAKSSSSKNSGFTDKFKRFFGFKR